MRRLGVIEEVVAPFVGLLLGCAMVYVLAIAIASWVLG